MKIYKNNSIDKIISIIEMIITDEDEKATLQDGLRKIYEQKEVSPFQERIISLEETRKLLGYTCTRSVINLIKQDLLKAYRTGGMGKCRGVFLSSLNEYILSKKG